MIEAVAIDFGTSRTKLAYRMRPGAPAELMLFGYRPYLPSLFYLPPSRSDVLWGDEAEPYLRQDPGNVIDDLKRKLTSPSIRTAGGRKAAPVELLSAMFSGLRRAVGEQLSDGACPRRLVIVLPALYRPAEEQVVRQGAQMAGFPPDAISTVSEPVAAANAWRASGGSEAHVIVVNAGAGKLDWTWLCRGNAGFRVMPEYPPGEDASLGGSEVDKALLDLVQNAVEPEHLALLGSLRSQVLRNMCGLKEAFCRGLPLTPVVLGSHEIRLEVQDVAAVLERQFADKACKNIAGYFRQVCAGVDSQAEPRLMVVGGGAGWRELEQRLGEYLRCTIADWKGAEYAAALGALTDGTQAPQGALDLPEKKKHGAYSNFTSQKTSSRSRP